MILEPIRIVTDWLAGTTHDLSNADQGINVQLAALTLDSGDAAPDPVTAVLDSTRSDEVAAGQTYLNLPVVEVTQDSPASSEGEVRTGASGIRDMNSFSIAIRYIRADWNTAAAETATLYTLKAIVRSLRKLLALDPGTTQRTRLGVAVMNCTGLRWGPAFQKVGAGFVTGVVVADFKIRDTAP